MSALSKCVVVKTSAILLPTLIKLREVNSHLSSLAWSWNLWLPERKGDLAKILWGLKGSGWGNIVVSEGRIGEACQTSAWITVQRSEEWNGKWSFSTSKASAWGIAATQHHTAAKKVTAGATMQDNEMQNHPGVFINFHHRLTEVEWCCFLSEESRPSARHEYNNCEVQ